MDPLVTREIFPLFEAIEEVRRRFIEHRLQAEAITEWFPCA
ncbi:hypothetical protein [Agromyces bauzanensis]|nr:hypothetical protein [Agromyces bauzanensis]